MSNQITISGINGNPPYDVYVCDITNTYCYLITGSTTIPPTLIFTVPPPLDVVDSFLLKLIDSKGCEKFILLTCPIDNKMFEDGIFFLFEDGVEYIFEG